jgi:hypothetical protein
MPKKIENILLNHAYNPAKWDTNWVTYEKTALSHRQARQEVQVLINILYNMSNGSPLSIGTYLAYPVCTV